MTTEARTVQRTYLLLTLLTSLAASFIVLSFDSLIGSTGGVVAQPALGRVADVYGYGPSYLVSAAVSALAIPFIALARRERASSDPITGEEPVAASG